MFKSHGDDGYRTLAPGVAMRSLVHGDRTVMVRFRIAAGSALPPHRHPHEQTGLLLSGRATFTVAGEPREVGPGDSWCIPGDVEHSFVASEDCEAIELFAPVREEYLG